MRTSTKKRPSRKAAPKVKPIGRRIPPRQPVAPKKPVVRALDVILADVSLVFQKVDAGMVENINEAFRPWGWASRGPFAGLRDKMDDLRREIALTPEGGALPGYDAAHDLIEKHFGAPAGEVPAWSRPGKFMMWIGYIPIVCLWGGYVSSRAAVFPAIPTGPALSTRGYDMINFSQVDRGLATVRDFFFAILQASINAEKQIGKKVQKWEPVTLAPAIQQEVNERLDDFGRDWIAAALAGKPNRDMVIPLPTRLAIRQRRFFDAVA